MGSNPTTVTIREIVEMEDNNKLCPRCQKNRIFLDQDECYDCMYNKEKREERNDSGV